MDLKKLNKETLGGRCKKGIATVSFTRRGLVILSERTMNKLELKPNSLVDIFQGEVPSEFFISRGTTFKLRKNGSGGGVFNSMPLCTLVMEKTWQRYGTATISDPPDRFSFTVCNRSVDDEENKHVFGLIRKKE